ncbi:MAG TPA: selenide, water dikinase SelD, partial [Candidatus Omnitrophota bacterium]|nr:selenide, water dikinase SelD [Candidatus Omnitrophota bacterium]
TLIDLVSLTSALQMNGTLDFTRGMAERLRTLERSIYETSDYMDAEFIGPVDERTAVRFTLSTLRIYGKEKDQDAINDQVRKFIEHIRLVLSAQGKKPAFALSILGLPNSLDTDTMALQDFLSSIVEGMDSMRVPVVGGHTITSQDMAYTLILVEVVPANQVIMTVEHDRPDQQKACPISRRKSFVERDKLVIGGLQGCAAKYPAEKLDQILDFAISQLPQDHFANLHVKDDVVLYYLDEVRAVAFSVDVIKTLCNSSEVFGRTAIVHALSDLYAKGIRPQGVVPVMFAPAYVGAQTLAGIAEAGRQEIRRADAVSIGGYQLEALDLFYGALVYGTVERSRYISNSNVKEGDWLILTKPLGTGVLLSHGFGNQYLLAAERRAYQYALNHLVTPNRDAGEVITSEGVDAATDITGFGFIGHLLEMIEPAGMSARLWLERIPILPRAREVYLEAMPCSVRGNMRKFGYRVDSSALDETDRMMDAYLHLLYDAQTSGGLLIAVSPEKAARLMKEFESRGVGAAVVGEVVVKQKRDVIVEPKAGRDVPVIASPEHLMVEEKASLAFNGLIEYIIKHWDEILQKGAFMFDVDGTLFDLKNQKKTLDDPEYQPLREILAQMLLAGARIGFVTANLSKDQKIRVTDPLIKRLKELNAVHAAENIVLYACLGAVKVAFGQDGKCRPDTQYNHQYTLPTEDVERVRAAITEIVRFKFACDNLRIKDAERQQLLKDYEDVLSSSGTVGSRYARTRFIKGWEINGYRAVIYG